MDGCRCLGHLPRPRWRPAPEGTELIVADRAEPGAYDAVAGREWDEIVEISSIPEYVAAAVDALAARTRHWTYVSSLSVYATNDEVGADESAPLSEPARPGDEYDYWIPTRSNAAYRAAGGRISGIRGTLERTLADERARGLDRARASGLTRTEELSLLAELTS